MTFAELNMTGLVNVTRYANDITGGNVGWAILVVLFVVMFGILKVYPPKRAFVATMFFINLVAYLLYFMQLLNESWLITVMLIGAGSFFWLYFEDQT